MQRRGGRKELSFAWVQIVDDSGCRKIPHTLSTHRWSYFRFRDQIILQYWDVIGDRSVRVWLFGLTQQYLNDWLAILLLPDDIGCTSSQTVFIPHSATMPKHPLDPLSVDEVRKASQLLLQELSLPPMCIRFKVVDLAEPSKDEVLAHLQRGNRVPDRKARIYYHQKNSKVLTKSILNVSSGILETTEELPDVQGPVDWVEYDLVTKACNKHPAVLAEIAKLKVPPRYA